VIVVTTPLGAVGLLAVVSLTLLFADLSRRLCAVTKMPDHHHWFVAASVLIALAAASQVIRGIANLAPDRALPVLLTPWFSLASFHIPLAVGVTLCLVLVCSRWGWILKEKVK